MEIEKESSLRPTGLFLSVQSFNLKYLWKVYAVFKCVFALAWATSKSRSQIDLIRLMRLSPNWPNTNGDRGKWKMLTRNASTYATIPIPQRLRADEELTCRLAWWWNSETNQITFVTSPQHKCLGEWNSWERALDSAKKLFTYRQYTQCTIKTYLVINTHYTPYVHIYT